MKTYKLIKEYPGSPKLGTAKLSWGAEDYPEFWEEVVEKEYKILCYSQDDNRNCHSTIKRDKSWDIHSVKRLSDGEVFSIGDTLTEGVIQKITLSDYNDGIYLDTKNYIGLPLKKWIKNRLVLFTTEDGVDIFEGDKIYWINLFTLDKVNCNKYKDDIGECDLKDGLISLKDFNKSNKTQDISFIGFSTKKAAEKYILMNKPCLSLNDVASVYITADKTCKPDDFRSQSYRIQQLVKQKLKN